MQVGDAAMNDERILANEEEIRRKEQELVKLRIRQKRLNRIISWGSLTAAAVSISGVVVLLLQALNSASPLDPVPAQLSALSARVSKLERRLQQLDTQASLPNVNRNVELQTIAASTTALGSRLDRLENAVRDDPAKALELPLIRRDIDALKEHRTQDVDALRQELARVYDLNKWFIGLMATMAIGMLTLAISNFLRRPSSGGSDERQAAA
jgi:hypothetical protein